jgi:signal transduction histidine kinase/ActR/RegA family two-component response regulator
MTRSAWSVEQHAFFFGQLAAILGSTLDYEDMLQRMARLAVPFLGDLCAVDLLDAGGAIRRAACAHVDATKEGLAYEARARHGYSTTASLSVPAVVRSRRSVLVSPATATDLERAAGNEEQLDLFRRLGATSWMVVPMIVRDSVLGTVTFAVTESDRQYGQGDLQFAEAMVGQAATAGDNARLYRAAEAGRAAAEAANRAKDQFLSTLSHELRAPLNAIFGWATMLERGDLPAEQARRALQIILRNVNAQVRLIDDLLDLSRIGAGQLRLDVKPVDLRTVIVETVEGLRPAADAKSIQMQTVLASPGGPVSGDPDRLRQVVWNLLSNAVKFTPKAGRVQIQLQRVNSHVEIVVSDTGIGITPDFLPFVFDRFRQGDSSSTRARGGLGLGLALVRNLVELHGGTVAADSPGEARGATFVVKLPLMLAAAAEPLTECPAAAAEPPTFSATAPSLNGVRVLVVDDDLVAVDLTREILMRAGAQVWGCAGGGEALAMLQQCQPDVLVSDIEMPNQDGYFLIRRVRELEPDHGGRTPAVALSAYSRPEDRIRSLKAGFNLHVSKPVEPSELITVVASLAGRVG